MTDLENSKGIGYDLIALALIKFHSMGIKVIREADNPFHRSKYASLENILDAIEKPLSACGLCIVQMQDGLNGLRTVLLHESGQFISDSSEMEPKTDKEGFADPQKQGSRITYQRRYSIVSMLCLNVGDIDDDAAQASNKVKEQKITLEGRIQKWIDDANNIKDLEKCYKKLNELGDLGLMNHYNAKKKKLEQK